MVGFSYIAFEPVSFLAFSFVVFLDSQKLFIHITIYHPPRLSQNKTSDFMPPKTPIKLY